MSEQPTYSVFLETRKVPDVGAIADAMTMVLGGLRIDHLQTVCRSTGFLAEGLERVQTQALLAAVKETGVRGFALPADQVPGRPHCVLIRNADCLPEGLNVQSSHDEKQAALVPWNTVQLISVGTVEEILRESGISMKVRPSHSIAGGFAVGGVLGASIGAAWGFDEQVREAREEVTKRRETNYVDIFLNGSDKTLRIQANGFNYDYLGSRLQASSALNFGQLLGDLAGYITPHGGIATAAVHQTVASSGKPPREVQFKSFAEFDAYNRHYLTLLIVARQLKRRDQETP
jgi:hypothetical protein